MERISSSNFPSERLKPHLTGGKIKLDLKGFLGHFEILSAEVLTSACPILPVSTSLCVERVELVFNEFEYCICILYWILWKQRKHLKMFFMGSYPINCIRQNS